MTLVLLGIASAIAIICALWLIGPRRLTRTRTGFLAWMLMNVPLNLLMFELAVAPETHRWAAWMVLVPAAAVGVMTYIGLWQMDDRKPH